jgi:hypothetical protein
MRTLANVGPTPGNAVVIVTRHHCRVGAYAATLPVEFGQRAFHRLLPSVWLHLGCSGPVTCFPSAL